MSKRHPAWHDGCLSVHPSVRKVGIYCGAPRHVERGFRYVSAFWTSLELRYELKGEGLSNESGACDVSSLQIKC